MAFHPSSRHDKIFVVYHIPGLKSSNIKMRLEGWRSILPVATKPTLQSLSRSHLMLEPPTKKFNQKNSPPRNLTKKINWKILHLQILGMVSQSHLMLEPRTKTINQKFSTRKFYGKISIKKFYPKKSTNKFSTNKFQRSRSIPPDAGALYQNDQPKVFHQKILRKNLYQEILPKKINQKILYQQIWDGELIPPDAEASYQKFQISKLYQKFSKYLPKKLPKILPKKFSSNKFRKSESIPPEAFFKIL